MSSQRFRVSGISLLVGAAAFIAHIVARSAITAAARGDTATFAKVGLWVTINALGVIGAALVLLGMPAMYARIAGPIGLLGLVGVVLIALGWMFFGLFLSLFSAIVLPWLADKAPSLVDAINQSAGLIIAFIAGLVAVLVGTVLLAIPFIRGGAQPRWVGYVLVASALMTVVGDFIIAPNGPATNLAVNLPFEPRSGAAHDCARLSGLPDVVGVMPQSGNASRGVIPDSPEDRISLGVLRRLFCALRPNPDWSWGGQVRLRSGA